MLPLLFIPPIDLNITTTVQKKQLDDITIGCYTTVGPAVKEQDEKLATLIRKINQNPYATSLTIDEMPNIGLSGVEINSNEFIEDYDVNLKLPIKKSFKAKAKVKSISKFTPQPYLD